MDLAPLGKVLNEDSNTGSKEEKVKSSSSLEKRVHQRKWIVHPIKQGRKEIHQGEIRLWESIKLWEKREGHQTRKDFNQEKKREIFIKLWENTNSSKDTREMRFHERAFKLRRMSKNEDSSKAKFNQIEEDEEKKK